METHDTHIHAVTYTTTNWANENFINLLTIKIFISRIIAVETATRLWRQNAYQEIHRNILGGNVLNCNALEYGVEIIYCRKIENPLWVRTKIQCILITTNKRTAWKAQMHSII